MSKTVIFGGSGFVGKSLCSHLPDAYRPNTRLDDQNNISHIADIIGDDDTIILLAALTPGRGSQSRILYTNIRMIENLIFAMEGRKIRHFINFSTDSVYPIDDEIINENKVMQPDSLYGLSHMVREAMLKDAIPADKLTIFRPTGIYGVGDTHNSYGTNRFIAEALKDGVITLFGDGEDIRGHVYIDDVVNIILHAYNQKIMGEYNIGSTNSCTFRELAETVQKYISCEIKPTERKNPITKRFFDVKKLVMDFPAPRSPIEGAKDMIQTIMESVDEI